MTFRKTVAFSKDSANLFFHILTECNLNCRHCYINPEQHGKGRVPLKTIKAWLGEGQTGRRGSQEGAGQA